MNWDAAVAARGRRAAEIEAMRIAAALGDAGRGLRIERNGAEVRVVASGLFQRMLHEPALRFAARWGR
ncbi:hypothetical protein WJT74_01880 [Sphingomicrobium sp. XHP0239]|uniref:hypothetical protein n=1 Tax=Sphingomicrobium maritimum TaxID=3133972 RepID=UPI0031CCCB79